MSVSRIKVLLPTVLLAFLVGPASAEMAPLALPPPDNLQPITAMPQATPESMGLALSPPSAQPAAAPAAPPPPPQQSAGTPKIEEAPLGNIKTGSVGLLANSEGGLGAGMWKGTSLPLVERFMPMLSLPLPFSSLNNLAARFLLTTAGAPEGEEAAGTHQTLAALRVDHLVDLGQTVEAWKLANLAGMDQIDDATLRQTAEAALVSPAAAGLCAKLPDLIKTHSAVEWQKLMVVCQLQAKDVKAAQLSLDLLHAQDIHDDTFFALAEKTIMAGGKQLPRQLTPLKPLTLALLRLTDFPMRAEIYARPDAALVAELLKAKAADETARLSLAERAAAKGIIDAAALAEVYNSQAFPPGNLLNATLSGERGATLRALLYQASQQEKNPKIRAAEGIKFLESLDATTMGGSILTVMGAVAGEVQPATEFNDKAAALARLYMLAGKYGNAQAWLEQAHGAARGMPQVAAELQMLWPLIPLCGMEPDKDFAADLDAWLGAALRPFDPQDADARDKNAGTVALVLLMNAAGFQVNDGAWAKIAGAAVPEKSLMPPALVLEKLRNAATANHKGEAILMGLLAATGGKSDPPLPAILETIRGLRAVGLAGDAGNLAKEAAMRIMYPPARP